MSLDEWADGGLLVMAMQSLASRQSTESIPHHLAAFVVAWLCCAAFAHRLRRPR